MKREGLAQKDFIKKVSRATHKILKRNGFDYNPFNRYTNGKRKKVKPID